MDQSIRWVLKDLIQAEILEAIVFDYYLFLRAFFLRFIRYTLYTVITICINAFKNLYVWLNGYFIHKVLKLLLNK